MRRRRANRTADRVGRYTPPVPAQASACRFSTTTSPNCASTSTGSRSSTPGDEGRFPDILNNPRRGGGRKPLRRRRRRCSTQRSSGEVADRQRRDRVLPGERRRLDEDVEVYTDDTRTEVLTTLHNLRQQGEHRTASRTGLATSSRPGKPVCPTIGAFAVTAGLGSQEKIAGFRLPRRLQRHPLESVADRLAEAFAERMHQRVRKEFWGYQPDEQLDNGRSSGEVRRHPPAPGYPACPEHTEKATLSRCWTSGADRYRADRVDGDVARRRRQRLVLLAPAVAVLRGRPVGPGPGRRLRASARAWTLEGGERWLNLPTRRTETNGRKAFRAFSRSRGTIVRCERSCWTWTAAPSSTPKALGRRDARSCICPRSGCWRCRPDDDGRRFGRRCHAHRVRRPRPGSGPGPWPKSSVDATTTSANCSRRAAVASWRPGVARNVAAADVPLALVTNTRRALTEKALKTIGRKYFSTRLR